MFIKKRTKAEILLALGAIILFAATRVMSRRSEEILPYLVGIAGGVIFTYGCMGYAQGKGYSRWFGLLGILACVGFAILVWLPDRHVDDTNHPA